MTTTPMDHLPKGGALTTESHEAAPPGTVLGTVRVPLSTGGEHDGTYRELHPVMPTADQAAWAEGAFYRIQLAFQAVTDGAEFDQAERGRVFSEVRRLTAVFLSAWETDWCEDALASGRVQLADMWGAIVEAFTASGGAPINPDSTADADIVV